MSVGDQAISVVVADDSEERQIGLTGQDDVPEGADGMLFVYDEAQPVAYWMLGVPIALDIWFFDEEGLLAGTATMAPCDAEPCPTYPSPEPVRWVLETVAGEFAFEPGAALSGAPSGESP